jgi:hypothetical protein
MVGAEEDGMTAPLEVYGLLQYADVRAIIGEKRSGGDC